MKKLLLFFTLVFTALAGKSQVPDFAWARQAKGQYSANNEEFGQAIARDNQGNSYVTGNFHGGITLGGTKLISSGSSDVFIVKYDAAGNILWAQKAGGIYDDNSIGVAVDNNGNSYITGYFTGSAIFGSTTLTSSGYQGAFVAKYDASGNALWAIQPADGSLQSTDIAVDGSGNSYVTGYFYGSAVFGNTTLTSTSTSGDAFVARYDAMGNSIWAVQAEATDNSQGTAIAVDGSGNAYVTGNFQGSANFGSTLLTSAGGFTVDVFIAKYDAAGYFLWAKQAVGTDYEYTNGIAVDGSGNSYVTGYFYGIAAFGDSTLVSSGDDDAFIAKYDTAGNVLWAKQAFGTDYEYANSIDVDSSGNSYITGSFYGSATFGSTTLASSSGSEDVFLVKYDAAGYVLWTKQSGGTGEEFGKGIAVDGNGNSYLTGYFDGNAAFGSTILTSSGSSDAFIARFDAAGNFLWGLNPVGFSADDYSRSVATDASGNIYVTGSFKGKITFGNTTLSSSGFSENQDIFIAKYDAWGNVLWAKQAGGTGSDYGSGLAIDNNGNIYVTGYFNLSITFGSTTLTSTRDYDSFVAKYDAAGNVLWAKQTNGTEYAYTNSIAVDGSGNCYVTGYFYGNTTFGSTTLTSTGNNDVFVVKFDALGNALWARKAGGTLTSAYGFGITVDGSGNSYVTGFFIGNPVFGSSTLSSSGNYDVFLAKYDAAGNLSWAKKAGSNNEDRGYGIAVDGSGNAYVTGGFRNTITFGSTTLTSSGSSDIFVAKYNAAGNVLWARKAGGTGGEYGNVLVVDGSGNSYVTGYFSGNAVFGNNSLTSNGGTDVFIAKYDAAGNLLWSKQAGGPGDDSGQSIARDGSGKSYVTGRFSGSVAFGSTTVLTPGQEMFLAKISEGNAAPIGLALSAAFVNENVSANTAIGIFSTTDPDAGNTFTYTLVAGPGDTDNAIFGISGDSLKVNTIPDFEAKSSYHIRVRTADQDGLYFEYAFVITVHDLNETPTNIAISGMALNENVAAFTTIGNLSATDPDAGNTFTYSLVSGTGSTDNAAFDISGDSLRLTVAPDFEVKSSYSMRIRATDQGGLFFEKAFTVTINDVNEAPANLELSGASVDENVAANTYIGRFSTSDPDTANTFTYSLAPGTGSADNAAFALSGDSLKIGNSPDFESKNSYSIRIRTTDQAGLSFEQAFTITVKDLNETPDTLALSAAFLDENIAPNTIIGTFTTTDPDADSTFTYSLVPGTGDADNAAFTISGNSLHITASPDFELKNSYGIRIRTTDQGGLFFEKPFTITVIDLNETPTDLTLSADTVSENISPNAIIGTLSASDPDAGNSFTYALIGGTGNTDSAAFNISGGTLRISVSPDFEVKSSYSIRIRATDQGGLFIEKPYSITINDRNETPSNLELSATSVNENVAANTTVGTLSTTDQDTGNTFAYSLEPGTGSTDNAAFSLIGNSLIISNSPDFETKSSYNIRIRTTDQGGLFFEKAIIITVNDLNETGVVLSATTVTENVPANTTICSLSITPPNTGSYSYSLVTGPGSTDNAAFNIYGNSLRITASPDFEAKSIYNVRIRATNQGGPYMENAFIITVNDVNEKPANLGLSAAAVNENVVPISLIGTLSATDPDAGNTFSYSLVAGTGSTDNAAFTLADDSLRIFASPNFEAKSSYSIRIRTTDQGGLYFEKTFAITIGNLNEMPVNLTISANAVNENVSANTTVGILATTDPDAGNTFTYSLVSGADSTDNAAFNIYGNSLRITASPNFEVKSSYKVLIRTTDQGGLSYDKAFVITISNVNEKPANLEISPASVDENVAANTTVATFVTTDPDAGNTFTYAFITGTGGTDNAAFSISGDALKIKNVPNYEAKKSYSIRIRTTDQGGLAFIKVLTITVNDVNETPTTLALSATSVFENVAANTLIGTLTATDPDAGSTFTYALVTGPDSTDNAAFNISGNSLRMTSPPDFEAKSSYSIRIMATDQGGLFLEKNYTIAVTNINEAPVNLAISADSVDENVAANTTVGTITTTDQDAGNTFTYALVAGTGSTDNAAFNISGNSLQITTSPNFEVKNSYSIRIRTTDQGGLFFEKAVVISVNNINETTTDLNLSATTVNENVAKNTIVGTITATAGAGNTFTYSLVGGTGSTDNAAFNIYGSSLRTTTIPNFEAKSSYSIRIRATDQGGIFFEKPFTISINDVNEKPATLTLTTTPVYENIAAYTNIGFLSSTDPDTANTFTYSLVSGTGSTDNAAFTIIGDSLQITVSPDYDTKNSYSIRIRTTDQGGLFLDKLLTIGVKNVNESPTSLALSPSSVLENVAATSTVGTFTATDPDAGSTFTYALVTGIGSTDNAAFSVYRNTLRIRNTPDFEVKNSYSVRIRVTDQGGMFYEKNLPVTVTDVNETPTNLVLSHNSVIENVAANTAVGAFATSDPDAGNTFTYSLVIGTGSTDNAAFSITGDSLRIIASPDFEVKNSYSIRIRATDQGGLFFERAFTIFINDVNESKSITLNNPTGTNEAMLTTNQEIQVYPNPSRGIFNLALSNTRKAELLVTDVSGKTIMQATLNGLNGKVNEVLDLKAAKGIYLLRIKADEHWVTRKLIVE